MIGMKRVMYILLKNLVVQVKGNNFKNKRVLMDHIHKVASRAECAGRGRHTNSIAFLQAKTEKTRVRVLEEQMDAD